MKSLKLGVAAIVALVAMSFTLVNHSKTSTAKKPFAITDCFRPGGTNGIKVEPASCTGALVTLTSTSTCSVPVVGEHIFSLDVNNVYTSGQISLNCPGTATFCCLTVVEDAAPCLSLVPPQGKFDIGAGLKFYKISAIHCKS